MTYIGFRSRGPSSASIASSQNSIDAVLEKAYSSDTRLSNDTWSGPSEPVSPATSASFSFTTPDPFQATSINGPSEDESNSSHLRSTNRDHSSRSGPKLDISIPATNKQQCLRLVDAESPVDLPSSSGFWSPCDRRRPSVTMTSEGRSSQTSFNSVKFDQTDHGALATMASRWDDESDDDHKRESNAGESLQRDSWGAPISPYHGSSSGDLEASFASIDAGNARRNEDERGRLARLASISSNLGGRASRMMSRNASEFAHHTISHLQAQIISPGIHGTKRAKKEARSYADQFEFSSAASIHSTASAPLHTTATIDPSSEAEESSFLGFLPTNRSQTLPAEYEGLRSRKPSATSIRNKLIHWIKKTASKMSLSSHSHRDRHHNRDPDMSEDFTESSLGALIPVYPANNTKASSRHDSVHDEAHSRKDRSSPATSVYEPNSCHPETRVSNYVGRRDDTPWLSSDNRRKRAAAHDYTNVHSESSAESIASRLSISSTASGISTESATSHGPGYDMIHRNLVKGEKKREGRLRSFKKRVREEASALRSYISTGRGRYGKYDDNDNSSVAISDWGYSPSIVVLL